MFRTSCLGCHTYFEEGEKVPLESISVEFKNYYLPLKDSKPKWIILKTIVGFLNSKGGTIYIGIEDNKGQVLGQQLSRKQKDEFLLFMKMMADCIIPGVDFFNKEQIKIIYVPVVRDKIFKGKYVIKIIVKQGNPSRMYHFNQVIELNFKGKIDQYDIPHAFYRHNMGGIEQIKGQALLEQIARKTASPSLLQNIFHQFCNPKPLDLQGPLTKIGFSGIRKSQLRQKLEELFHNNLQSFDIDYWLVFDIDNHILLICLDNEHQFKEINNYIKTNLGQLNKGEEFNFIEKGEFLDFYLYKNIGKRRGLSTEQQKLKKEIVFVKKQEVGIKEIDSFQEDKQMGVEKKEETKIEVGNAFEDLEVDDDEPEPEKEEQASKPELNQEELKETLDLNEDFESSSKQQLSKLFQKTSTITITHINAKMLEDLQHKLNELLPQVEFKTTKYTTTINLKFPSLDTLLKSYERLLNQSTKIQAYGQLYKLVIGANTNKIAIRRYNIKNRKQLKRYIQSTLKEDIIELDYKKLNRKFFLQITLKTPELACQWVDILANDNHLDKFNRPEANQNINSRLRVYLFCKCN